MNAIISKEEKSLKCITLITDSPDGYIRQFPLESGNFEFMANWHNRLTCVAGSKSSIKVLELSRSQLLNNSINVVIP